MKITLDHNCLINLENRTEIGAIISEIISRPENQCFIVNMGASELRQKGITPDRYDLFEQFLDSLELAHLPRLDPMTIFDVTFWDRCVLADDAMIKLSKQIEDILFPMQNGRPFNLATRRTINRICDIHTLWCHIYYENDIFLTADRNFMKDKKLSNLIKLGAKKICHPTELVRVD